MSGGILGAVIRRIILVGAVGLFASASAQAQIFPSEEEMQRCYDAVPTAFGDLQQLSDTISDSTITLQPLDVLPVPVRIGTYEQPLPPFSMDTDLDGYQIIAARAVTSLADPFGGSVELTYAYDEALLGFPETDLRLFALQIPSGQWIALPSTLDAGLDTISAPITAPALYGIGGFGPAVPIAPPWMLMLLTLGMAASGLWIIYSRNRALPTLGVGLLLIAAPVLGLAIQPEFTTPGNKPINHNERVGPVSEVNIGNPPMVYLRAQSQSWAYKGVGNVQDPANWHASVPRVIYIKKSFTLAAPNQGNASVVGNYDTSTHPYYNCAGYAVRNAQYEISDAASTQNVLDNEYNLKGNFGDGNFTVGDILTYKKNGVDTHVAVVTEVDADGKITKCRSKWGRRHLMDHSPGANNVLPIHGAPAQVYRKN